jgi:hypothetical protein
MDPMTFKGFFDDAALFPPGNAPMVEAVRAHLARRGTVDGELVGPFVCPTARLDELRPILGEGHLELALVSTVEELVDVADELHSQANLTLAAVEVKGPVEKVPDLPNGTRVFVERPWGESLEVPEGAMLKLRCGGLGAGDIPSNEQLGAAIRHCVDHDVAFKLTAGLHHAVRTRESHGFLNVFAAVGAALEGADPVPVLAELDPAGLDLRSPEAVRRTFRSIGTCSIYEPLDDLRALGLIA